MPLRIHIAGRRLLFRHDYNNSGICRIDWKVGPEAELTTVSNSPDDCSSRMPMHLSGLFWLCSAPVY